MTTLYGVNNTASRQNSPSSNLKPADMHGRIRRAYDYITLSGELSIADVIEMFKLPKGATIVDARFIGPSDGTTGQYDIGWSANGVDSAEVAGLFAGAAADTGGGAKDIKLAGTSVGYNKLLSAETQIKLTVLEATTASTGDTLELEVFYIVD